MKHEMTDAETVELLKAACIGFGYMVYSQAATPRRPAEVDEFYDRAWDALPAFMAEPVEWLGETVARELFRRGFTAANTHAQIERAYTEQRFGKSLSGVQ